MVQWLHSRIETITGAAVILAGASFASKLLGLIRNRVLAGIFGAGDTLDAYYAAFRIPDAIFQFIVLGALSAGFIPVFVELMEKRKGYPSPQSSPTRGEEVNRHPSPAAGRGQGEGDHWRVASSVLNALLILLIALTVIFIIFAPRLQSLIAPGFAGEKLALTIRLARIMALGPIFLGISAVFSGILQSCRRFLMYAVAPFFYNVGIIAGAVWLTLYFGASGLAVGVVAGAFLHMLVQFPTVHKVGFRWRPVCDIKDPAVRKIAFLSVPRILGLAVVQINFFVVTALASKLSSGSLSIFNLANDIQNVPIGLFGISLATAAFPAFSSFAARGDKEGFRRSFSSTTRLILFLTVPVTILLLLLRAQLTRVILGWGAFDWGDTIATADTLAFFSMSIFAQALIPLFARALYAFHDTISPFVAGVAGVICNIALALHFGAKLGAAGLALAFSAAAIVNVLALWIVLRIRFGSLGESEILISLAKLTAAALVMGLTVQFVKPLVAAHVDMQTGLGIFTQGFIAGLMGLAVFLLTALAMGSDEARAIKNAFTKRLFRAKDARPVEIVE